MVLCIWIWWICDDELMMYGHLNRWLIWDCIPFPTPTTSNNFPKRQLFSGLRSHQGLLPQRMANLSLSKLVPCIVSPIINHSKITQRNYIPLIWFIYINYIYILYLFSFSILNLYIYLCHVYFYGVLNHPEDPWSLVALLFSSPLQGWSSYLTTICGGRGACFASAVQPEPSGMGESQDPSSPGPTNWSWRRVTRSNQTPTKTWRRQARSVEPRTMLPRGWMTMFQTLPPDAWSFCW